MISFTHLFEEKMTRWQKAKYVSKEALKGAGIGAGITSAIGVPASALKGAGMAIADRAAAKAVGYKQRVHPPIGGSAKESAKAAAKIMPVAGGIGGAYAWGREAWKKVKDK